MAKVSPFSKKEYLLQQVDKFTPGKTTKETTEKIEFILNSFKKNTDPLSLKDRCDVIHAFTELQKKEIAHYIKSKENKCPYTLENCRKDLVMEWVFSIEQECNIPVDVKKTLQSFSLEEKRQVMNRTLLRLKPHSFRNTLLFSTKTYETLIQEEINRVCLIRKLQDFGVDLKERSDFIQIPIEKISKSLDCVIFYNKNIRLLDSEFSSFIQKWNKIVVEKTLKGKCIREAKIFEELYFGKKPKKFNLIKEINLVNIFNSSDVSFNSKVNIYLAIQNVKQYVMLKKISQSQKIQITETGLRYLREKNNINQKTKEDIINCFFISKCEILIQKSVLSCSGNILIENPLPHLFSFLKNTKCSLEDREVVYNQLYLLVKKLKKQKNTSSNLDEALDFLRKDLNLKLSKSLIVEDILKNIQESYTIIECLFFKKSPLKST